MKKILIKNIINGNYKHIFYFKVKHAYYIVCEGCCTTHKICSKCSKPSEELEYRIKKINQK